MCGRGCVHVHVRVHMRMRIHVHVCVCVKHTIAYTCEYLYKEYMSFVLINLLLTG